MRLKLSLGSLMAGLAAATASFAAGETKPADIVSLYSVHAVPTMAVVAVETTFAVEPGKNVRLTIYDSEENFLEKAAAKLEAPIGENGIALLPLDTLAPGTYAFAAYLDENGDGKLNRGKILGRPKEPLAFSRGVKIKLSKPSFDETKVEVAPGDVIVITLED